MYVIEFFPMIINGHQSSVIGHQSIFLTNFLKLLVDYWWLMTDCFYIIDYFKIYIHETIKKALDKGYFKTFVHNLFDKIRARYILVNSLKIKAAA